MHLTRIECAHFGKQAGTTAGHNPVADFKALSPLP